ICRLSVLPHKHPHELLDSVVKEQLVKLFVSTEAAHSTAAFLSVKLFFEEFFLSTQQLAATSASSLPLRRGAHSTAPRYSVKLFLKKFSFYLNNLALRQTWVRLSEARILHEHSEL
ncbi:hypothetical protein ABI260_24140, partial [Pseudomonas guguanensis]